MGPSVANIVVIMALHAAIIILASHKIVAIAAVPTDSTISSKRQRRQIRRGNQSQSLQTEHQHQQRSRSINADKSSQQQQQRQLACSTKKWHPEITSGNQNGCTNDDDYETEWNLNPEFWFHSSSQGCCDVFFGSRGLTCEVYDRCDDGAADVDVDVGEGDSGPNSGGGVPSGKKCAWHADMQNQDGCTTNDSYPPEWLDPKMITHMFHNTAQECCDILLVGVACKVYDDGLCTTNVLDTVGGGGTNGPESPPSGVLNGDCVSPGWHADLDSKDGCTNDDNYLPEWLSSTQINSMFYTTPQECCNLFFASDPASCQIYDRGCTIDPQLGANGCDGPTWVPDSKNNGGCTNDPNFPEDWKVGKEGEYTFPSAISCCRKYHTNYSCGARYGCSNEVVTLEVTRMPTRMPTGTPTTRPTRLPTNVPTPQPSLSPTVRPPRYFIVHGQGICANENIVIKPYYIVATFADSMDCCQASFAREKCFNQMEIDGLLEVEDAIPTALPTTAFVPPTVVDITMWGTLQLGNLVIPSSYNSPEWSTLKNVLMKTISFVMAKSPICHPGLSVELSTFAGQSFPARNRRRLDNGKVEHEMDTAHDKEEPRRAVAVAVASQTLKFEMYIPAKCDETCQTAGGYIGKLAFNDLEEHFQQYIDSGVTSSTLVMIGESYGLISDDIDEEESLEEAPFVSSGTLLYRHAVESDITWMPTFMPSIMMPTDLPTMNPTLNPTEEKFESLSPTQNPTNTEEPTSSPTTACSALKWHYIGDGGCTNSQYYPELWDSQPSIGSYFLFDTLEDCCFDKSLEQCIVTDTCTDGTNGSSVPLVYCDDRMKMLYHPTTPGQRTCTNSKDYPNAWDDSDGFLFVTAADCCAKYYNDELCLIKNVCFY